MLINRTMTAIAAGLVALGVGASLALPETAAARPVPNPAFVVTGTVLDHSGAPVAGAPVTARRKHRNPATTNILTTTTAADGSFQFSISTTDLWTFSAFPSTSTNDTTGPQSTQIVSISGDTSGINLQLSPPPTPAPPGTTFAGPGANLGPSGIWTIVWTQTNVLTTQQCPGGTVSESFAPSNSPGSPPVQSGSMTEDPQNPGTYTATIPPLHPAHGNYTVTFTVTCPGQQPVTTSFDIYIDPSGTVVDTSGAPIYGATVTLQRSSDPQGSGSFADVPDGSAIMSPANRVNPGVTGTDGMFGWDVIEGFYRLTASAPGCHVPGSSNTMLISPTYTIPPAVVGIVLTLDCRTERRPSANCVVTGASQFDPVLGATPQETTVRLRGKLSRCVRIGGTAPVPASAVLSGTLNGSALSCTSGGASGLLRLTWADSTTSNVRVRTATPTATGVDIAGLVSAGRFAGEPVSGHLGSGYLGHPCGSPAGGTLTGKIQL